MLFIDMDPDIKKYSGSQERFTRLYVMVPTPLLLSGPQVFISKHPCQFKMLLLYTIFHIPFPRYSSYHSFAAETYNQAKKGSCFGHIWCILENTFIQPLMSTKINLHRVINEEQLEQVKNLTTSSRRQHLSILF